MATARFSWTPSLTPAVQISNYQLTYTINSGTPTIVNVATNISFFDITAADNDVVEASILAIGTNNLPSTSTTPVSVTIQAPQAPEPPSNPQIVQL